MQRFRSSLTSAALFLSLMGSASLAFAHAHPKTMTPAKDAVVDAAPADVAITYTEGLTARFSKIDVTDHAGQPVAAGPSTVDPKDSTRMSVPLKPLQPGAYTVHWVAVADDGHRTQGDYGFTVK
ncbi:copper homeostasis periplasmic binding protein CopC [Robbsia sp. KACC 23696]|uniref:copper homeostasis periplasmic binding protein CopC n=1 Tax=Robbsia sp. KACC 23696 TaxID=3149231 RepID=UPI00325C1AAB